MREYITSDDICNQMCMNRSVFGGTFLLSEGNTDQRLYGKFTDKENVMIIPAHSKDNVRASVSKMKERRDHSVLGIMDRDLDDLKGIVTRPPLFLTDYRDMEMMIINGRALDDILSEYADPERLERFVKEHGPVRDAVIDAAYPVGLLMFLSQKKGYGLSFKELSFVSFVDKRTLEADWGSMVSTVLNNSRNSGLSARKLLTELRMLASEHPEKECIARGHDAVSILLIGLRYAFGSYNAQNITDGSLGGSLRIAFGKDDFISTCLYRDSSEWAGSNGLALWDVTRDRSPLS